MRVACTKKVLLLAIFQFGATLFLPLSLFQHCQSQGRILSSKCIECRFFCLVRHASLLWSLEFFFYFNHERVSAFLTGFILNSFSPVTDGCCNMCCSCTQTIAKRNSRPLGVTGWKTKITTKNKSKLEQIAYIAFLKQQTALFVGLPT